MKDYIAAIRVDGGKREIGIGLAYLRIPQSNSKVLNCVASALWKIKSK